ncbi:MAG: class IV adenylate cyclase [Candidatus Woesearchaeota archaeon]
MSGLKNTEIELKFPLLNPEELIKELDEIAIKKYEEYQKDTYFDLPHRSFLESKPIKEWLRIREGSKGSYLNYKNWHHSETEMTNSCDEYETKVEDIDLLRKIFENLGIKEMIIVEKNRRTWHYKDTEIAIDVLKDGLIFIEIEAKGEFKNIEEAKKYLYQTLNELNAKTGEQDFQGYPWLLLKKKGLI